MRWRSVELSDGLQNDGFWSVQVLFEVIGVLLGGGDGMDELGDGLLEWFHWRLRFVVDLLGFRIFSSRIYIIILGGTMLNFRSPQNLRLVKVGRGVVEVAALAESCLGLEMCRFGLDWSWTSKSWSSLLWSWSGNGLDWSSSFQQWSGPGSDWSFGGTLGFAEGGFGDLGGSFHVRRRVIHGSLKIERLVKVRLNTDNIKVST